MTHVVPWLDQLEAAEKRGARGCAGLGYSECPCEFCDLRFGRANRMHLTGWHEMGES